MCLIKSSTPHIVLIIVTGFFILHGKPAKSQVNMLSSDSLNLLKAQKAITFLYDWKFDSALVYIDAVKENYANHPASPFLEAMILYWQNVPKPLTDSTYQKHLELINRSIEITEQMLDEDDDNIEAIFFNLTGRGILMRYYAAVGKKMKAVGEARKVYRYTKKARSFKDEFPEFYFMVGLYDYFREAYPEKYPLYKPFAWFFESGDKEQGLTELEYAANHGVFSVPEALSYLAYINDKYEQNPSKSLEYLDRLGELYPNNLWFQISYIKVLIKMEKFDLAKVELEDFKSKSPQGFYKALANLFEGQIAELRFQNFEKAFALYTIAEQGLSEFTTLYYVEEFTRRLYEAFMRYYTLKEDNVMVKLYKQKHSQVGK